MSDVPPVIVIDDETGSRESMAIAIEKAGLGVRTFDDAREALKYLEENPGVQLAVCDLRMPGAPARSSFWRATGLLAGFGLLSR